MKLILYCAVIFLACALTCLTGPESVANAKPIPSDTESGKGSSDTNKDKCSSDSKKDKGSSDSKKDKGSSDSKKDKSSSDSKKDKGSSDSKKDKGSSDSKKDKGSSDSKKDKSSSDSESGELDMCSTSPCKNNGTCVEVGDNYTCSCSDGFKGRNCEELDMCSTSPCKNNGTCVEVGDNYTCSCSDGFKGRNCEDFEAVGPCPEEGWVFFSGSCYYLSDRGLDWLSAVAACNETGGYLAEIQSQQEADFTFMIANKYDDIWIGLNDIQNEGDFVWHYSGEPVSFLSLFAPSYTPTDHDCVYSFIFNYHYWFEDDCNKQFVYMCEKDATYN
ncbi:neurocan core protein-like [Mercenaria mercenaria]|uniref:neurocan core protein-like n=1 Tax=Mercenaria mercenaria TaxID=6596 RepID=UPI00234F4FCF|nr:neurocan core protein-like [Mercenaria mercenaria]XP_053377702.1 neurocan core protein-like [Mercenaria mercenaria]XP_053377703.1 neurocan core protein-like [Mercenaria mercenaria]